MERDDHIAGLAIDRLTPVDIDYFFRTLADRIPRRVSDELADVLRNLRGRVQQLAVDLGATTAMSADPADVHRSAATVVERIGQMRRRAWRAKIDGRPMLDHVRRQVGEISADLRELGIS